MKNNTIKLLYFSPTGTTRKVLESIAKGITDRIVEHIDLTMPENGQKPVPPFKDEIVLIGVPVYGGRVPVEAIKRLQRITANKTLAIPVVVYGNREFEDALLELKNLRFLCLFFTGSLCFYVCFRVFLSSSCSSSVFFL